VRELPAIHAKGDFFGDRGEFFFLDDEENPLTLKFSIGDRDTLEVIKIATRCQGGDAEQNGVGGGAPEGGGIELPDGASELEQALALSGEAVLYDIHFSFDSHQLRPESEPRLREIAAVLARHPDWRLSVNGHTDAVASEVYNLELSRRRAAAVKAALVDRFGVLADRLVTAGFGEGSPRDNNDTLAGRARNRRVELIRLD
jgi:outer membrane protein OmpA-like peptidoglycan-associated protein